MPETSPDEEPRDAQAWRPRGVGPAGRRRRRMVRRSEAMTVKFSLEEREVIGVAAARAGVAAAAYVGSVSVEVARGEVHPLPADLVDALAELVETRTQLRRFSTLVTRRWRRCTVLVRSRLSCCRRWS